MIKLTKKEYFIGKALQGLCANGIFLKTTCKVCTPNEVAKVIVRGAIDMGDEMIKQLEDENRKK